MIGFVFDDSQSFRLNLHLDSHWLRHFPRACLCVQTRTPTSEAPPARSPTSLGYGSRWVFASTAVLRESSMRRRPSYLVNTMLSREQILSLQSGFSAGFCQRKTWITAKVGSHEPVGRFLLPGISSSSHIYGRDATSVRGPIHGILFYTPCGLKAPLNPLHSICVPLSSQFHPHRGNVCLGNLIPPVFSTQ